MPMACWLPGGPTREFRIGLPGVRAREREELAVLARRLPEGAVHELGAVGEGSAVSDAASGAASAGGTGTIIIRALVRVRVNSGTEGEQITYTAEGCGSIGGGPNHEIDIIGYAEIGDDAVIGGFEEFTAFVDRVHEIAAYVHWKPDLDSSVEVTGGPEAHAPDPPEWAGIHDTEIIPREHLEETGEIEDRGEDTPVYSCPRCPFKHVSEHCDCPECGWAGMCQPGWADGRLCAVSKRRLDRLRSDTSDWFPRLSMHDPVDPCGHATSQGDIEVIGIETVEELADENSMSARPCDYCGEGL